jgi:UDP-GlcNAc:undecaprenyl-phosphate/decaprenyl-phosphate GlcNAc-1-phosphate transferase
VSSWGLLLIALGAALLSAVAVALSIRLADRWGVHDHPDLARKSQSRPVPLLGGLAMAVAFSVAAMVGLLAVRRSDLVGLAVTVLVPALMATLIGFLDDRRSIDPTLRLGLQAGVGLLAWLLGSRVMLVEWPAVSLVLTVVWFMVIVNGINLLDNSDGLAGGTVLVSSLGASLVAVLFGQDLVALMGFALVGACAGFLWHNWYPATVYMGDAGAYFLGFMLAALVLHLGSEDVSPVAGAAISILLVLLPVVDTAYVVLTRIRAGVHPFTAGRDHLAHVLQRNGRSVPASVLTLHGLLGLSTVAAVALAAVTMA